MSAVVDAIVDVFETVITVTLTITLIGPTLSLVSDDFKDWYLSELGEIMSWFGIDDEDVVQTQVQDQRLMNDEQIKSILTKVALDHQTTQDTIISLLSQYTSRTRAAWSSYFQYGKSTYTYNLPDANIRAATIPTETASIISTEYGGVSVNIIQSRIGVPTKEEYVYYKLNKLYNYKPWLNTMTYNTYEYTLKVIDYNYTTNNYDSTIYRAATLQINTITEIWITVTPYDATQDTKTTRTKITEERIHSIEGISYTVISDTTVDELVPIGSVVDSYSIDTVYGPIDNIEYGTTVVSVVAFNPVVHIVVKWYQTVDTQWYYWTYELGSGNTVLDSANRYISNVDMLPIVEVRNNKTNVNSDKTSDLYKQSKEILDIIGIDIDTMTDSLMENPDITNVEDAYVYFGVNVKEANSTVAKLLYNAFEYLYYDKELQSNTGSYSIRITEGKYNVTLLWRNQTRTIVDGIIGPVGTHSNHVAGNTLVLRSQETPEQYVEYQIIDMGSTTFIKRGIYAGVVAKTLQNDDLIFPISFYIVDQMTPIEQIEIFCRSLRLATYAISVTHLEWYETSAFMDLIQIILIAVAIVIFVLSLGSGTSVSAALMNLALAIGASMALKELLKHIDSPWLKALLIAIIAVVAATYGYMDPTQAGFFTADQITQIVTDHVEMLMVGISEEAARFSEKAEDVFKKLSDMSEQLTGYLDTDFVANLSRKEDTIPYITGPTLEYYRAVEAQYDWDLAKGRKVYDNVFEYDKYYMIGIV